MEHIFDFCPAPPDFVVDWARIDAAFEWVRAMRGCPQDAIHHAEGDVWIHTRMVCEAMAANPAWRALSADERRVVFTAALMHDVAKPLCTKEEDGRITSRGHSKLGERAARALLWEMGLPMGVREQIVPLILFHQTPFFLIDRPDAARTLFAVSQSTRCDHLALVTEADARGRFCADQQRLFDNIALFAQFAEEQGCLREPRGFANAHSRFQYFRRADRDPDYAAFDDTVCEVVLMSGLPGAGKDTWIAENLPDWPVIALDDLREELEIEPTENQGPVVQLARERAREFLRRKERFVWNATNLSRELRGHCLSLLADYNAYVKIVYVESPARELFAQNQNRSRTVPPAVIRRLLGRWEVPDLTEAQEVLLVGNHAQSNGSRR